MKYWMTLILSIALLSTGCNLLGGGDEPVVAGVLTAELPQLQIKSGDDAVLHVDGMNTGDTELDVGFVIVPKNPESVQIQYPGELRYVIRPQETTGRKVITVSATTEAERSDYAIDIFFRNIVTGENLDEMTLVLTVTK